MSHVAERLAALLDARGMQHLIEEQDGALRLSLTEAELHNLAGYGGRYLATLRQDVATEGVVRFTISKDTARTVVAAGQARLLMDGAQDPR
ncbi:hypothetical protein AB0A05_27065 [Streptomyces sp. NPDC046374]|uniref:hypothetical protein n=1 Tax=Streptomyces sp. NPDC046374 TaxID=3154917 RepID=UPI0033E00A93